MLNYIIKRMHYLNVYIICNQHTTVTLINLLLDITGFLISSPKTPRLILPLFGTEKQSKSRFKIDFLIDFGLFSAFYGQKRPLGGPFGIKADLYDRVRMCENCTKAVIQIVVSVFHFFVHCKGNLILQVKNQVTRSKFRFWKSTFDRVKDFLKV